MSKFLVQIKNYQIISSAKLEFDDGLTIIVGDSNNGKTSVLRAIEAAIFNKLGNSFIKTGEKEAAVGIKCDNHTVIWKKSADAGVYIIDGQTYNKIGRGQLVEVANTLNISEIDVNQDKVRINFLRQMEYPFLLVKNPSQLFEFLSMSNDNDNLSEIFKNMRSDLKATNSSIDTAIGKIDSYKDVINREEELLKNYDGIDSITEKIISYDSRFNDYNNLVQSVEVVGSMRTRLLEKRDIVLSLRNQKASLEGVIVPLEERINSFSNLRKVVDEVKALAITLTAKQQHINELKEERVKYESVINSIDIDDINKRKERLNKLRSEVNSLSSMRTRLLSIRDKISSYRVQLTEAKAELDGFTTCPLCGSPLNTNHECEA